jgi:hypothetical protein
MIDPKIRIQLMDPTGAIIGDRLVSFKTEMYSGPKLKHQGPVKIEIDLHDKESVDQFKTYLDKLVGDLPIGEKKTYKKQEEVLADHPVDDMIDKISKLSDQDKVTLYLKDKGYRFVNSQVIEEFVSDGKLTMEYKHESHPEYQWLVRMVKEAKDPANDKYDFSLIVGIKIIGKSRDKILIYQDGKFDKSLPIKPHPKPEVNMKEKKALTKFPQYMEIEERKTWRALHKKFLNQKPLTKSQDKFYHRWAPAIAKLNTKQGE